VESYDYVDRDPVVPIRIQSVTGFSWSHIDSIRIEIFGDKYEIFAVMSDDPEILIGMEILDNYVVCFDGIKKRVTVIHGLYSSLPRGVIAAPIFKYA